MELKVRCEDENDEEHDCFGSGRDGYFHDDGIFVVDVRYLVFLIRRIAFLKSGERLIFVEGRACRLITLNLYFKRGVDKIMFVTMIRVYGTIFLRCRVGLTLDLRL